MTFGRATQAKRKAGPAVAPSTPYQEFEAPKKVLVLLVEVMLLLGATKDVAREAARTGRVLIGEQRLLLACAPDDTALVVSVLLDPDWANQAARKALLQANTQLMLFSGIVAADGYGGPSLMCRWPLAERQPIALANWLQELAALAMSIQAKRH